MLCCGREVQTKFCPNCGKRIGSNKFDGSLHGLMRHVESRVLRQTNLLERVKEYVAHKNGRRNCTEKRLKSEQVTLEKWVAWAQSLRDAIEKLADESAHKTT